MALDPGSRVRENASSFSGQKSGLPIESYGIKDAEKIENFLLKEGALVKTNGTQPFFTVPGSPGEVAPLVGGGIYTLHYFQKCVVAQRGPALAIETTEGSQEFTILDGTLPLKKLPGVAWRDRLFLSNDTTSKYYLRREDGVSDQNFYGNIGLDPPPFPGGGLNPLQTDSGAGLLPTGKRLAYLITLFDEKTNTESPACGAVMGETGLYDLSPNSALGPTPFGGFNYITPGVKSYYKIPWQKISGGEGSSFVVPGLSDYLRFAKQAQPRATHFIVYRASRVGDEPGHYNPSDLWESFLRVPFINMSNQDGALALNNQVYMPIDYFLDHKLDFEDNSAIAIPVGLPENNSPPPTKARGLAGWTEAANNALRIISGGTITDPTKPYDVTKASGFKHMRLFRDQLFGVGAASPGYDVKEVRIGKEAEKITGRLNRFRDILHGSEVYQPDYFTYVWEIGVGDGQRTVGLGVLGDVALLIFKNSSTYYLAGSSPDNYVLRVMDTNKGCLSEHTIQETPAGVICLDGSGFVLYNKIGLGERISKQIQDIIGQIQFKYADNFYSFYDPKELRYYCSVCMPGNEKPNITLCLDLATMEWTTTLGQEGGARFIDYRTDGSLLDVLGSAVDGALFRLDNPRNTTFRGSPMESVWTSGTINFGDDQRKKKLQWIYLKARGNTDWTVDIEVIPDNDEARKFIIKDWNVVSSQSKWYSSDLAQDGSLVWEQGVWAGDGPARRQSKIPISCLGYKFQIRIIHKDFDPEKWGFAMETISAEAVIMGR